MSLWNSNDDASSKPKYLSATDKAATLGVDINETAAARDIGIRAPGWVKYQTYTDSNGNVRHKSEVLVAASSMKLDAGDDAILKDVSAKIKTQPISITGIVGGAASFSITVDMTPTNAVPTYQWQKKSGTWANVAGATAATYSIPTLTLGNAGEFRCLVNSTGAKEVTSKVATLTVNAS